MIGILYIATGKYKLFFKNFYSSMFENFLIDVQKEIIVFTDEIEYFPNYKNVKFIKIDHNDFPLDSLLRFRFFNKNKELLSQYTKLIFFNSNMIVIDKIQYCDFFQNDNSFNFLAVNHPGWFNKTPQEFPYEQRPELECFCNRNDGKFYYQGCLFAGKTKDFLLMCEYLDNMIIKDLKKNLIAVWHDESYLNKFFTIEQPFVLSPSFAYPEFWQLPFDKKIIQLEKKVWFQKL
jgi:hypothetical protein